MSEITKRKVVVGEKLYCLYIQERDKIGKQKLKSVYVTKVGKESFICNQKKKGNKFENIIFSNKLWWHIVSFGQSRDYKLYESKKEYKQRTEINRIWDKFNTYFNYPAKENLTLKQMKKIEKMIDKGVDK